MTHYYKDGEWKKPGVTSIIKDCNDKSGPLCQWSANMVVLWIKQNCEQPWIEKYGNEVAVEPKDAYIVFPDELDNARMNYRDVLEDAGNIGSDVHAAVEEWLKTGKEPHNPREEVLAGFVAFLEFYDQHKMKPLELEFSVLGDYWGGTLDYYGWFDGKLYVIDFKTSKYHYLNEHGPQIAAYRSEVKSKVDGCGVLRLDKITGYPDFKDYSKRYLKDLEHFKLMVPLYLHRHPRIAKGAGWDAKPF